MAVVSVNLLPENRDGTHNRLWQRTYSLTYRVVTDSRTDGPVTIRATATGLPQIGNTYNAGGLEVDNGAFAETINFRWEAFAAETGGCSWLVTVNYGPYDAQQFTESPVDWPIKPSWGSEKYQEAVDKDIGGNTIRNKADDPYAEPVMRDFSRPVLTIVRNEAVATYDPMLADLYRDKVNNAAWNGFDPFTVKINEISTSEPQYDSNSQTWYFAVRYVFAVNRNTWKLSLLEQGFNYLDTSTPPKPVRFLDKDGQEVTEPKLLDTTGVALARPSGTPVYTDWEVYDETDFSKLNLNLKLGLGS